MTGNVPTNEIDFNTVISNVFVEYSKLVAKSGYAPATKTWRKVSALFREAYSEKLAIALEKCSKVKTLLNPDHPVPLLDIYTQLTMECSTKIYSDNELIQRIEKDKFVVVVGTGGSGKSMFMKYLTYSRFENPKGKIPIFVELRQLNDITTKNLSSFIHNSTKNASSTVTQEHFEEGLQNGAFTIILDGLDEVDYDKRGEVEGQILDLSRQYPKNHIIVSSRPDERFGSWELFYVYRLRALDLPQIKELVEKIPFHDEEIRASFIRAIDNRLYESHQSFLEIPLLANMMLLTFSRSSNISMKLHAFYWQAFEALYFLHDATKPRFERKLFTGLEIDDFRKILSAFCRITYVAEKYEFESRELEDYSKKAISASMIDVSHTDFIKDMMQSVCLLQKEGTALKFVHRSFQEYFCADFICTASNKNFGKTLDHIAARYTDSVLEMVLDMAPALMESEWILPRLNEITGYIKDLKKVDQLTEFLSKYTIGRIDFLVQLDGSVRIIGQPGTELSRYYAIESLYADAPSRKRTIGSLVKSDASELINELASSGNDQFQKVAARIDALKQARKKEKHNGIWMFVAHFDDQADIDPKWLARTEVGKRVTLTLSECAKIKRKVSKNILIRDNALDDI